MEQKVKMNDFNKSHEFSSIRRGIKDANGIVRTITVLTVLNPETGLYRLLVEGLQNLKDDVLSKIYCIKGRCNRNLDTFIVTSNFTGGEKVSVEEMDEVAVSWIKVYKKFIQKNDTEPENQIQIQFNKEDNRHPEASC